MRQVFTTYFIGQAIAVVHDSRTGIEATYVRADLHKPKMFVGERVWGSCSCRQTVRVNGSLAVTPSSNELNLSAFVGSVTHVYCVEIDNSVYLNKYNVSIDV